MAENTDPPAGPTDDQKAAFKGMFAEAMDEWVTKKREEEKQQEDAPKRTQAPTSLFTSLFGG